MEEVLLRFPHIGERIFDLVEDKDLIKCKNVSKTWRELIPEKYWIRIIKSAGNPSDKWNWNIDPESEINNQWVEFFDTYNSVTLCEMASIVHHFPLTRSLHYLHFIPTFERGRLHFRKYNRLCEYCNQSS